LLTLKTQKVRKTSVVSIMESKRKVFIGFH